MGNRILVEAISEPLIKQVDRVQMQVEAVQKIDGLFISSKSSSTGIGSFARSTTKLKLHHASEHKLVLEGKNCLIIIDSEKCNRISFPEGLPHGLHIAKSSDAFAILMPRGKGQIMGLLDYDSGMVSIIEFSQRMRTVECCNEYWVTVTAPSRGSSKNECPRVYCADKNGMIKWEKKILYGDFDIWAAKVIIAEDMRNFLVIDLKDMYVFSRAGELERNISMRDFSRAIKHTGFFGTESEHQGQTYIHWQEISFSEYITARSKAFRYDFSTGDYYALRSLRKMVLACDAESNRKWIANVPENSNVFPREKKFLKDLIVVSGREGSLSIINKQGKIIFEKQLPGPVDFIVESQDGCVLSIDDAYEFDIEANQLTSFSVQDSKGKLVFSTMDNDFFYDKTNYLWKRHN